MMNDYYTMLMPAGGVSNWLGDRLRSKDPDTWQLIGCFGGDRLQAVADGGAIAAVDGDDVVGLVTWSPTGEYGGPNLVGLWVARPWRRRVRPEADVARRLIGMAADALRPRLYGRLIRVDYVTRESLSVFSPARLGDLAPLFDVRDYNLSVLSEDRL